MVQRLLKDKVGTILVCEPYLKSSPDYDLVPLEKALKDADILVVLTDHRQFYEIDPSILAKKIVIDTRGIYEKR